MGADHFQFGGGEEFLFTIVAVLTMSPLWLPLFAWQGWLGIDWAWVKLGEPFGLFWAFLMWCMATTDGAI